LLVVINPIPFLKNDIHIRSEPCFGWNHTIRFWKLSESVSWCSTYISVLCLFCLQLQKLFCLQLNMIGWS